MLAVPILFEKYLLGVVQLINKRHGVAFTAQDEDAAEEIARILGIAFYNQHTRARARRSRRSSACSSTRASSPRKTSRPAVSNARVNNTTVEKVLIEDYNVPREEIGRSLAAYYSTPWFNYDGTQTIPADLKERVSSDIWKKHVAAPVERKPGVLVVAVDDPQDLTRLDGIRAMNLAPRYEFQVAMKHDILAYIAASYGEQTQQDGSTAESADWAKILDSLGEGEKVELDDRTEPNEPEIDETDSGIVKLANQLIIEAFARGASDIHIEPDGPRNPCVIRLRIDGDCAEVHGDPRPAPQRARAAPEDHGQARHLREAQAAGRQDPLQVFEGNHRAARGHDPDREPERRRGHAHPGRVEAAAARQDGLQRAQPRPRSRRSWRSRTASRSSSVRPAPARPPRCTPPSASSTPWT